MTNISGFTMWRDQHFILKSYLIKFQFPYVGTRAGKMKINNKSLNILLVVHAGSESARLTGILLVSNTMILFFLQQLSTRRHTCTSYIGYFTLVPV